MQGRSRPHEHTEKQELRTHPATGALVISEGSLLGELRCELKYPYHELEGHPSPPRDRLMQCYGFTRARDGFGLQHPEGLHTGGERQAGLKESTQFGCAKLGA